MGPCPDGCLRHTLVEEQHGSKFISAHSAGIILPAQGSLQILCNQNQIFVSVLMSIGVVVLFEPVHIHHNHHSRGAALQKLHFGIILEGRMI